MNPRDLARWRLSSVGLQRPTKAGPADVVGRLLAVQSQDHGPATWSVGQRIVGATAAEVDAAFDAGEILRTHVLRPTWHYVTPHDIRWLLALTAPRVHRLNALMYARHGLDRAATRRVHQILRRRLAGTSLTRAEIAVHLGRARLPDSGQGLAYALMHAELDAVVCSGPMRGKQHTYALLDERAPDPGQGHNGDAALAELVFRYVTSHGPVLAKDVAWWATLTLADVQRGIAAAGDAIGVVETDGRTYYVGTPRPRRAPTPSVHLLQAYDEYVCVSPAGKALLDVARQADMSNRPSMNNLVVLNGQVIGRWRRTITERDVLVETLLCVDLTPTELRALKGAVARHGRFVGRPARLSPVQGLRAAVDR